MVVDQAVTIDHQSQHAKVLTQQREILTHVVNAIASDASENEIRQLLRDAAGTQMFEKAPDEVVAGQVQFFFNSGRLLRVEAGNESVAAAH
jgi:hypothetical protein